MGDVASVQQFLGRPYRLVCDTTVEPGSMTAIPRPDRVASTASSWSVHTNLSNRETIGSGSEGLGQDHRQAGSPTETPSISTDGAWLLMPSSGCVNQGVGDGVYGVTIQAVANSEVDRAGCVGYVAPQSLKWQSVIEVSGQGISMPAAALDQSQNGSHGLEDRGEGAVRGMQGIRYIMIDLHCRLSH